MAYKQTMYISAYGLHTENATIITTLLKHYYITYRMSNDQNTMSIQLQPLLVVAMMLHKGKKNVLYSIMKKINFYLYSGVADGQNSCHKGPNPY